MQVAFNNYQWAAAVATELVNTAPGVWNGQDKLSDTAALVRFLTDHRLDGENQDRYRLTAADLRAVRRLRQTVRQVLDHPETELLITGGQALTASVGSLGLAAEDSGQTSWTAVSAGTGSVADDLSLVCGVGILGVVHALGANRFRPCAAPTCSGVFIDTSRPGRRRYCMPDLCGNRVNVANHRARTRHPDRAIG